MQIWTRFRCHTDLTNERASAMATVTVSNSDVDASDLPTKEEITETFERLGLAGSGPSGYQYISAWNASPPAQIFNVVRTTTSSPR